MAIFLSEFDIQNLIQVSETLEPIERVFSQMTSGNAKNLPRRRLYLPQGAFHLLAGASLAEGYVGLKAYTSIKKARFYVLLFSIESGELLAMMEADALGQIRTGAASGVATKLMAAPNADTAAIIGSGWQAKSQLEAVHQARPLQRAFVFSKTPANREKFAQEMSEKLALEVTPAESVSEAVEGAQIVCTITSSREPVLLGEHLKPGMHVNAAGANSLVRRELDTQAVAKCDLIAVDSLEQAQLEASELVMPWQMGKLSWERIVPLAQLAAGHHPGRTGAEQITLFKSLGVGLEDVAVAALAYEKAKAQGVGISLPF